MRLSTQLKPADVAARMAADRRVRVPGILAPGAAKQLAKALEELALWSLQTRIKGKHADLDPAGIDALEFAQKAAFNEEVGRQAREGFQYLFDSYPLYDRWHAGSAQTEAPMLAKLFEFLNGEDFLGFARTMLNDWDIGFADAQVTRYRAGHFLTQHDDNIDGKNRVAAYVLNMTPDWRPDWGGQLQFYDADGHVEAAYRPTFNALSVLGVPTEHAVSVVAPDVTSARYAVTGWLRRGDDPGL